MLDVLWEHIEDTKYEILGIIQMCWALYITINPHKHATWWNKCRKCGSRIYMGKWEHIDDRTYIYILAMIV